MRETETAQIVLNNTGVVIVRIRRGVDQQPVHAHENMDAAHAEGHGRRRPVLVDVTGSRPLPAETRHAYMGDGVVTRFSAVALVVEASPFGRMMGNLYFQLARLGIPAQLFTSETRALQWLTDYVD